VRIIAGRYGGRRLAPVPRRGVRPTADPVREALFSILGSSVAGRPFVDLCAGTGAVGLEAFSRGAAPVVLVERSREAFSTIRKNLALLGLEPGGDVRAVRADVGAWLTGPGPSAIGHAAVIYLDPPWAEERRLARWLAELVASPLVGPDSLVIVEHRAGRAPAPPGSWAEAWARRYGDTGLLAMRPAADR